jgi:integrase
VPKHKIQRQEEISTENWQKILKLAKKLNFKKAYQVPKQKYWFSCVLAIIWLTGKRINEVLQLKRKDIIVTETQIRIKFFVGKKKSRKTPIEQIPYQKVRTIQHKAVPHIIEYLNEYDKTECDKTKQLFPANTTTRTRNVKTTFINGDGETETRRYSYQDKGGYIYPENARYWLSKINKQLKPNERIYFHYGRHSIGIKLAYQGKSNIQIAKILDETPRAAIEYTKHAGGLDEEWTNETE